MVKKSAKPWLIVAAVVFLLGCNSTPQKDQLDPEPKAELMVSENYIPVVQKDKTGLPVPYVAAPNPYSGQKGRIDKEAIVQFIDAQRAYSAGNYAQAKIMAQSLTVNYKKLSGPWVLLGDIELEEKQLEAAEAAYATAIIVNQDNVNAYLKQALVQREQGEYLEAQNTLVEALQSWPDFPEAHLNLAIVYDLYLNHPIRAQRHYEAYQFLTDAKDANGQRWLEEIQVRTGLPLQLQVGDDQAPEVELGDE
ncbi:tetratricopeptide repeat protein [Agaribacterium sp. ZY112]|uniref:tetratricopeptide repeat protein n=1 Tax=Agaribacterium sp. ZY112 TaxID=3233574 RepID=UPI0035246C25